MKERTLLLLIERLAALAWTAKLYGKTTQAQRLDVAITRLNRWRFA